MPRSPTNQPSDEFKGATKGWLDDIIRQGELRLQAQLQAAIAADARAGLLASIQAATSAALVVFGGSNEVTGDAERAAYVAASFALVGSILALIALRPITFDFAGLRPRDWLPAIETNEPELSAKRYYAGYLDEYLCANDGRMRVNGRLAFASICSLIIAPLAAIASLFA